ncbi:hypothetical protein BD779DRAFT_1522515 [Infundibulicybe gibba]|nr:hypothetical protein BD779DRAFT_1522515 [Infundibulicybe gibba]
MTTLLHLLVSEPCAASYSHKKSPESPRAGVAPNGKPLIPLALIKCFAGGPFPVHCDSV